MPGKCHELLACKSSNCSIGAAGQLLCQSCRSPFVLDSERGRCVLEAEEALLHVTGIIIKGLAFILFVCALVNVCNVWKWFREARRVADVYGAAINEGLHTLQERIEKSNIEDLQQVSDGLRSAISLTFRRATLLDMNDCKTSNNNVIEPLISNLPSHEQMAKQAIQLGLSHWYTLVSEGFGTRCFGVDMKEEFIVGVGLPLFYHAHSLPVSTALLAIVSPFVGDFMADRIYGSLNGPGDRSAELRRSAQATFLALSFLYVAMVVFAFFHSIRQRKRAEVFDHRHSSMQDYTLVLDGLPRLMTSEVRLLEVLRQITGDKSEHHVVGVSIAYDLAGPDMWDCINDACEDFLAESQDDACARRQERLVSWDGAEGDERKRRKEKVEKLLGVDKLGEHDARSTDALQLRGSGRAFMVLKTKAAHNRVSAAFHGFWMYNNQTLTDDDSAALCAALRDSYNRGAHSKSQDDMVPDPSTFGTHVLGSDCVLTSGETLPRGTHVYLRTQDRMDWQQVEKKWQQVDEKLRQDGTVGIERLVTMSPLEAEPPSALWYNFGTTWPTQRWRLMKGCGWTLLTMVIISLVVYKPYCQAILLPYSLVDSFPGFVTCQVGGWIFGIANAILCTVMWVNLWGVGFEDWFVLDKVTLRFNMVISLGNTIYNLGTALEHRVTIMSYYSLMVPAEREITDEVLKGVKAEQDVAQLLYNILVPGWLFSGFLMGQMMGTLLPLALNLLYVKAIFVWRCFPRCINRILTLLVPYNPDVDRRLTDRLAELIFEPGALSLAWDYSGILVTPMICLLNLFLPLEVMPGGRTRGMACWRIFPTMLGWTVFTYCFHRFVRLPLAKKQMHSSAQVDFVAQRWWGGSLAMVAAAWAFWGWRLGYFLAWMMPVSFLVSLQVDLMGHELLGSKVDAVDHTEEGYEKVQERLKYSWFNTNPIHLLKSHKLKEDVPKESRAFCPFVYGKEHLLGAKDLEKLRPVIRRLSTVMEQP